MKLLVVVFGMLMFWGGIVNPVEVDFSILVGSAFLLSAILTPLILSVWKIVNMIYTV